MQKIKQYLERVLYEHPNLQTQVWQWHEANQWQYKAALEYSLNELDYHFELLPHIKLDLLTCEEYLKTYHIRENGKNTLPNEWVDATTQELSQEGLDNLWLKPDEGYLVRLLKALGEEGDREHLKKVIGSKNFNYQVYDAHNIEERKTTRLTKLQQSIDKQEVVLFLGRQNRVYKALQNKLNEQYAGKLRFISDHVWSSRGYIAPGVKASDNRLSLIQAAETIHRLPHLGLTGEAIAQRFIMFSLDNYTAKTCMAAMYSNCNRIARSYAKPQIEGIDRFVFAYTGLTDLELANIVRNKHWLSYTRFCRTGANGEPEELSPTQVLAEYGIKPVPLKIES